MASRKAYSCFACRDKGFDNVMVLLDGKDDQGKTKYLNEDGTRHNHKEEGQQQPQQPTQQQSNATVKDDTGNTNALLKIIIAELQRLIKLFEE